MTEPTNGEDAEARLLRAVLLATRESLLGKLEAAKVAGEEPTRVLFEATKDIAGLLISREFAVSAVALPQVDAEAWDATIEMLVGVGVFHFLAEFTCNDCWEALLGPDADENVPTLFKRRPWTAEEQAEERAEGRRICGACGRD